MSLISLQIVHSIHRTLCLIQWKYKEKSTTHKESKENNRFSKFFFFTFSPFVIFVHYMLSSFRNIHANSDKRRGEKKSHQVPDRCEKLMALKGRRNEQCNNSFTIQSCFIVWQAIHLLVQSYWRINMLYNDRGDGNWNLSTCFFSTLRSRCS